MQWEYFTHDIKIGQIDTMGEFNAKSVTEILNWYGSQGWELVSSFPSAHYDGGTTHLGFIFKRQKAAPSGNQSDAASAPPVQS